MHWIRKTHNLNVINIAFFLVHFNMLYQCAISALTMAIPSWLNFNVATCSTTVLYQWRCYYSLKFNQFENAIIKEKIAEWQIVWLRYQWKNFDLMHFYLLDFEDKLPWACKILVEFLDVLTRNPERILAENPEPRTLGMFKKRGFNWFEIWSKTVQRSLNENCGLVFEKNVPKSIDGLVALRDFLINWPGLYKPRLKSIQHFEKPVKNSIWTRLQKESLIMEK